MSRSFLSVDWGTSNFRIRLVELPGLRMLAERRSATGVKALFARWNREGGDREERFIRFLADQASGLGIPSGAPPVMVVSGMASSSIGMRELPYVKVPVPLGKEGFPVARIRHAAYPGEIRLTGGLRTSSDVMRGEEMMLLGLAGEISPAGETVAVLPGTHSKQVVCREGKIVDFRTFMTGELFDTLARHTLLKQAVIRSPLEPAFEKAFDAGVREALAGTALSRALFAIRARHLLEDTDPRENYHFLSGLVIGAELEALCRQPASRILLCAGPGLERPYRRAFEAAGLEGRTQFMAAAGAAAALVAGQALLLGGA